MAQVTKFTIDPNLSGIQLRTQASEMLTALSTLNSGDLEPVNPTGGMLWLDTTNNILKIRDKTNTAWLDFASVNDKVIAASTADSAKLGGLAADKYAKKDDIPAAPKAATETEAGIVKLKNSITGNLADTAISENAAKQYADAISNRLLGIDQTLQNVTSQRQIGVTYTNKTGRPIQLTIMCLAWTDYTIKIGDVSISFGGGDQGRTSKQTYYGIVPNDVEYSLTRGGSFYWWELR
nr:MAG TPA: hypothetical protein [Caudoviricetes sp.]